MSLHVDAKFGMHTTCLLGSVEDIGSISFFHLLSQNLALGGVIVCPSEGHYGGQLRRRAHRIL